MESPRGLNDPSLGSLAKVFSRADLIVSLGKAIDFTMGFGGHTLCSEGCRWLVVNADAAERDRAHRNLGARLERGIAANPRDVAAALATGNGGAARADWRGEVAEQTAARSFDPAEIPAGKITPAALCAVVQRHLDAADDPILISDGGEFGQWAQACLKSRRRLINGPSGAIGGSVCYGIAAKKAAPAATVITMMGDGTVGFHLSEFETAAREGAAFVAVIGNDECWNAEHQIQMRTYGPERLIGCALSGARYDLAVASLGGHGEYVTELADLDGALARASAAGKPACVNVAMEGLPAPSAHA
jgi:acetolactate synthase-1/2/3 large subunit